MGPVFQMVWNAGLSPAELLTMTNNFAITAAAIYASMARKENQNIFLIHYLGGMNVFLGGANLCPHLTSPALSSVLYPHLTSPVLSSVLCPHLTSPHLTSPHPTSPHPPFPLSCALTSPVLSSVLCSSPLFISHVLTLLPVAFSF